MCSTISRTAGVLCLSVTLVAIVACRRPAKDNQPVEDRAQAQIPDDGLPTPAADDVRAKQSTFKFGDVQADSFDIRKFPQTGDVDLVHLKAMPQLRRLVLDKAPITDEGMKTIGELARVTYLSICETQVTDVGLAAIKDLSGLEVLRLDKLRITDAGLEHVKAFPKLKHLSLWRTLITDDGLAHLKTLMSLEHLSVDETRVSDAGIRHLYGLPQLKYFSKWRTKVTPDGVKAFKQNMPNVKVNPG